MLIKNEESILSYEDHIEYHNLKPIKQLKNLSFTIFSKNHQQVALIKELIT